MSREISQDFFSYFKDVIWFSDTWRTMEDDASKLIHYIDVMMGAMASQITSLTIVYSTVYSDADQGKHHNSASLAFVWGIHLGPVNSHTNGQ